MKTMLFITLMPISSPESASVRNRNLLYGFIKNGYQVDVLTTDYKGQKPDLDANIVYLQRNPLRETFITNTDGKLRGLKRNVLALVRRIYKRVAFFDSTKRIAMNADASILPHASYDLVITSSDPVTSHLVVPVLRQQGLHYTRWIQYWGDPYVQDIARKKIHPNWLLRRVALRLQSDSDRIVYVSPFTLRSEQKMFPESAERMCFLPIPFRKIEIYPIQEEGRLRIGYFGKYQSDIRDIMPLYNACVDMADSVDLYIIGNSDLRLEQRSNIHIFQRMDTEELRKFENLCSVYVCVMNRAGTQIPGKLYHNAGTNKPVLVLIDGDSVEEMTAYLEGFGRFAICANESKAIMKSLEKIRTGAREAHPCERLKAEQIAAEFANL